MNKSINATFNIPMDPLTVTTATFTLAPTLTSLPLAGTVNYDPLTKIATFIPTAKLTGAPATNYTATIKSGAAGVKDLSGGLLASDKVITFTTNASTCTVAPVLGAVAPFGSFSGTSLINDGPTTLINGSIGITGAATSIVGLIDSAGTSYPAAVVGNQGSVNGVIYTNTTPAGLTPGAVASKAAGDALVARDSISPAALLGGIDVSLPAQCPTCTQPGGVGGFAGDLAGRTLPPGVYKSAASTYAIGDGVVGNVVGNLTLDAAGDVNAVWVFQAVTSLTVGVTGPATPAVPIQVLLINGAQSKNVFWYVGTAATINTGATMVGTIMSSAATTFSTTSGVTPRNTVITTLNGRAIALNAGVTMTNTVINVPAP
jgi:hypothetical protein